MVRVGVYDQIKKAYQDLIAPELHAIRGDIRLLDQKIDGIDARLAAQIDGVDARFTTRMDALDQKIGGLDARLTTKIDSLRTETVSLKGGLLPEIRRPSARLPGVGRELQPAT